MCTIVFQQLLLQLRQSQPVLRRAAAVIVKADLVQLQEKHRGVREEEPLHPSSPLGPQRHLQPQVVVRLVRHLPVAVVDVALADQAVDGPLVRVGAVPQSSAVVEAELVL